MSVHVSSTPRRTTGWSKILQDIDPPGAGLDSYALRYEFTVLKQRHQQYISDVEVRNIVENKCRETIFRNI